MRELARRLMSCPGWRWTGGMRCKDSGWRWRDGYLFAMDGTGDFIETPGGSVPNLRDPATLGCLLALVREAWGRPALAASPAGAPDGSVSWCVEALDPDDGDGYHALTPRRATEAEALVDALEEAPCES